MGPGVRALELHGPEELDTVPSVASIAPGSEQGVEGRGRAETRSPHSAVGLLVYFLNLFVEMPATCTGCCGCPAWQGGARHCLAPYSWLCLGVLVYWFVMPGLGIHPCKSCSAGGKGGGAQWDLPCSPWGLVMT